MRSATAAGALFLMVMAAVSVSAAPPASGSASGDLVVNGKKLPLKYAVAAIGPDSFDETKEAVMVLLTPEPVPRAALDAATTFDRVRGVAKQGLVLRFRAGEGFHLTLRHPALGDHELQTSGGSSEIANITTSGDTVAGTIAPWSGKEDDIMSYHVAYTIKFSAPIVRRFPLEKPLVFSARAKKLGPGGGAPGKVWLDEKCKPVPTDPKGVEAALREAGALPTDKDLQELSKRKGHPVTRADFIAEMTEMLKATAALRETDCKVLGGTMEGDVALLQVEATTLGSRGRTDITMVRDGAGWKVKKEGTWRSGN